MANQNMNNFCVMCGQPLLPDTRFCGGCGTEAAQLRIPATSQRNVAAMMEDRATAPSAAPNPSSFHWGYWFWLVVSIVVALGLFGGAGLGNTIGMNNSLMVFVVVFAALVCLIYCLPAIIAFTRRHRSRWVILAINLAFGATVIGWVIALVWALNIVDAPIKGGIKYDPQPHDPIL